MLNFTEHMKRIIELAEEAQLHSQTNEILPAAKNLMAISDHCEKAIQQLDQLSSAQHPYTNRN